MLYFRAVFFLLFFTFNLIANIPSTTQTTMTIGTETFITSYNYHNTLGRLTQQGGTMYTYASKVLKVLK